MAKDPKGFIHLLRHIVDSFLSHPYGSGYDEWIDSTGAFDHYFRIQRKKGSREELIEQGWRMWQAGINQQRQLYVVRFAFGVLLDLVSSILCQTPQLFIFFEQSLKSYLRAGPRSN
jgi:hypothetical protein